MMILNEILDKKIAALIIVRLDGFDNCATELREKMKEMVVFLIFFLSNKFESESVKIHSKALEKIE
jgi:hypothetical protein